MAIPGNFLSAATESMDPDITGWRVRENCTTSQGTGGRNGDGCLTMTATAAGEMQAETTAAYPVVVGTEYYTFADASSATQPERIGIEWLDDTYTPVGSMTWSLTTANASSLWHRVSVAGSAPAGATQARVVLSATATAAGALEYFENVYLGPPKTTPGNLFGFNVESSQEDGAISVGWINDANAAISRTAPAVQWPVDFYLAGGHVITITASADGDMATRQTTHPAITPGTDYLGYMYLNPPAAGSGCWVELWWLDAAGDQISVARSYLDAPSTGWYRQRVSGIAPDGAVSVELAAGMEAATAGQALSIEGVVLLDATDYLQDGNVVPYEDASFEQGVGSWTVDSGTATIARSTPWDAAATDGAYSLTVSSSATSTNTLVSAQYPVGPGQWMVRADVMISAGAWDVGIAIHWYDSGGTSISVDTLTVATIPADGDWWYVFDQVTAPSGAASARVEVSANATAASSTLQMDSVELYPHLSNFVTTPNSAIGSVSIVLRELTVGDLMRLYRVVGSSQTLVRGPDGWIDDIALTSDQYLVEDYEAPFGVPFFYRAEYYTTSGDLDITDTHRAIELTLPDPSDCWIKDVLQPERNVLVRASVAPDWSRPIEQTPYRIRGRRNSVVLSDVRGGLTGTVQVWTMDDTERAALHFALDTGSPLLLQFAPGVGLEDAYYAVGDVTEARFTPVGSVPRRLWSLALTQVDAPIGGVSGTAGWTVQDLLSTWDTVQDASNAYASVLDMALDQREV